jgi:hypothetical protein
MSEEKENTERRVTFESVVPVQIMAIDGTWRRACTEDRTHSRRVPPETAAHARRRLNLKEFFLLLSSTGLAFRRCELDWINGDRNQFPASARQAKKLEIGRLNQAHCLG